MLVVRNNGLEKEVSKVGMKCIMVLWLPVNVKLNKGKLTEETNLNGQDNK